MAAPIDLDAYFRRIGYDGGRAPTLETLRALHARHTEAIPFENLNPFLGWPVLLDLPSIERKLVGEGRGGYCFEQNSLFRAGLEALGFATTGLAARVIWNEPEGAITPRSHMLLRVEVGGSPYVADVGFGGQTLTGPLRLEPWAEQATPHEPYRLMPAGDEFVMEARIRGGWRPLYRFDLKEQPRADYEVSNWYLSHHPESHFVTSLIAARQAPGHRYTLRDRELAVHRLGGGTERRTLADVRELREALEGVFRIGLPDSPELEAALGRVIARPS